MAMFILKQASDWHRAEPIEINTMEELLAFVEEHGDIIVYSKRTDTHYLRHIRGVTTCYISA